MDKVIEHLWFYAAGKYKKNHLLGDLVQIAERTMSSEDIAKLRFGREETDEDFFRLVNIVKKDKRQFALGLVNRVLAVVLLACFEKHAKNHCVYVLDDLMSTRMGVVDRTYKNIESVLSLLADTKLQIDGEPDYSILPPA